MWRTLEHIGIHRRLLVELAEVLKLDELVRTDVPIFGHIQHVEHDLCLVVVHFGEQGPHERMPYLAFDLARMIVVQ